MLATFPFRRLATVNHKGGSGKTTTAVNLSAALGEIGRRVLLVDLDPQASATLWCGVHDGGRVLLDVLDGADPASAVRPTETPGVDLIPSSTWLVNAERHLAAGGTGDALRRVLATLPPRWDYVIIDCPPAISALTIAALTAADEAVVPVEAHVLALDGLAQLLRTVDLVRDRANPHLRIAGIVACRVDGRTRHAPEIVAELRRRFGPLVYGTVIRENVRLAECPSFAAPITRYDTRSSGAADYRALAREVVGQEVACGAA